MVDSVSCNNSLNINKKYEATETEQLVHKKVLKLSRLKIQLENEKPFLSDLQFKLYNKNIYDAQKEQLTKSIATAQKHIKKTEYAIKEAKFCQKE